MNHSSSFDPKDCCSIYNRSNTILNNSDPNISYVKQLFEKKFSFTKENDEEINIPPINELFQSDGYKIENLEKSKIELNSCKSKLNDYQILEWNLHTKSRNPASGIVWKLKSELKCEFVTQAWCKFYECVYSFNLVPKFSKQLYSLHLCEAPGAFVTSLNHYLKLNHSDIEWNWRATTLNPYHEGIPVGDMVMDDRFLLHTLDKWIFGIDSTGNIMNLLNINNLKEKSTSDLGEIDLITADGSINCFDEPENQEIKVIPLQYAETIAALKILKIGGNFIIKMFTFFEYSSVNLLFLLYYCFKTIHFFKPATSKGGNSEVYVICLNNAKQLNDDYLNTIFSNINNKKSMFLLKHISKQFLVQLDESVRYFMHFQIQVIENNIFTYTNSLLNNKKALINLKNEVWLEYIERYKLKNILENQKILYGKNCNQTIFNNRIQTGSYSDRCKYKLLTVGERMDVFKTELYEIQNKFLFNVSKNLLINFQLNNVCCNQKFIETNFVGSKIRLLFGSKFVNFAIINYFRNVIEYKLLQCSDNNINSNFYNLQINSNNELLLKINFDLYFKVKNYDAFEKTIVIELLHKLKSNSCNLVIEYYPLLTHFVVSFIYFLIKFIYKNMQFYPNGGRILFYNKNDNCDMNINRLIKVIETFINEENEYSLLSFIYIPNLYEKEFFGNIESYNQNVCLYYCEQYLNKE